MVPVIYGFPSAGKTVLVQAIRATSTLNVLDTDWLITDDTPARGPSRAVYLERALYDVLEKGEVELVITNLPGLYRAHGDLVPAFAGVPSDDAITVARLGDKRLAHRPLAWWKSAAARVRRLFDDRGVVWYDLTPGQYISDVVDADDVVDLVARGGRGPRFPLGSDATLRAAVLDTLEEAYEVGEAFVHSSPEEIASELVDLVYVTVGALGVVSRMYDLPIDRLGKAFEARREKRGRPATPELRALLAATDAMATALEVDRGDHQHEMVVRSRHTSASGIVRERGRTILSAIAVDMADREGR